MRNVTVLTQRELNAQFYSPIAYVVLAVFLVVSGIIFGSANFRPGAESSVRVLFSLVPMTLVFFVPLLTMRLLADEFRSGTIETLMTAPINDAEVILGKFFGALLFYMVMLAATLVYPIFIAAYGQLDTGMAVSSYLGMFLVGALFISVGLFFSTCTQNQVVAGVCSIVLLAVFTFLGDYLAANQEGTLRVLLQHLSINTHYENFTRGMVELSGVTFFATTTILFLFLAVKMLEFRRWR